MVPEARPRGREGVPEVGLRYPVLSPLTGADKRRESDGDEDADEQNDHNELDEGEALVIVAAPRGTLEHGVSFLSMCSRVPMTRT